jgi:hypothetical protein
MYLAEMPMRSYRQWIANSHTLMELQEVFKVVCRRLPRYKNLGFRPYQMATLVHSDPLLKINDRYMATVMEMLIASGRYRRVMGVFGVVENEAVRYFLEKNLALDPIIEQVISCKPQGSVVRDIENL